MKRIRRLMALLLICCVVIAAHPTCVAASDSEDFVIKNGVLTKYQGSGGDVVIPDGVTKIGDRAFAFCTTVKSVRFPQGLTSIGQYAFQGCFAAEIKNLPDGVTYIGKGAFRALSSKTSYEVRLAIWKLTAQLWLDPSECVEAQSAAVQAASDQITAGLSGDYEKARAICQWVSETIRYDYAQYDGSKTISQNSSVIAEDVLESHLTTCGGYANLTLALLNAQGIPAIFVSGSGQSGSSWGGHAWNEAYLDGRWVLIDTTFGQSYFDMDLETFAKDHILWSRPVSNTEDPTADRDESLVTTEEPEPPAFPTEEEPAPSETPFPESDSNFEIKGNVLVKYHGDGGDVVIPNGVTSIGEFAFSNCDTITSVTIPFGVTQIGNNAFVDCNKLERVTIPASVASIGRAAFSSCNKLTEVTIPQGVPVIRDNCFFACFKLASVTIPASVTEIGEYAFGWCDSLKDIYYGGSETQWLGVSIRSENEGISKAKIHYNSTAEDRETNPFSDVASDAWYAASVSWAVEREITAGTTATTFSPNTTCTNAQILTFMWRAAGSPEPATASPFTNLSGSEYYAKAAVWAYEEGMVSGTSFDSDKVCTRAMTMEYFWKQTGSPTTDVSVKFADVNASSSYAQAVAWAVENGLTAGTSETTFSPDDTCTRAQIVTFLYRALM